MQNDKSLVDRKIIRKNKYFNKNIDFYTYLNIIYFREEGEIW